MNRFTKWRNLKVSLNYFYEYVRHIYDMNPRHIGQIIPQQFQFDLFIRFTKCATVRLCVGCKLHRFKNCGFTDNDREKNRIFGFSENGGNHIFCQNCSVTLVITASFEFWFLVRSQLAPRFLHESFLLNSKLILNQNPNILTLVQKGTRA